MNPWWKSAPSAGAAAAAPNFSYSMATMYGLRWFTGDGSGDASSEMDESEWGELLFYGLDQIEAAAEAEPPPAGAYTRPLLQLNLSRACH